MRLLLVSSCYPSRDRPFEGPFLHAQVLALCRAGVRVTVIAPVPHVPWWLRGLREKWRGYARLPARERIDGVLVLRPRYLQFPGAWFFPFSGFSIFLGIVRLVSRLHRESPFDLIQGNALVPYGLAALLLARRLGVPFLGFSRGGSQWYARRTPLSRRAIGYVVSHADRIVAVSRAQADFLGGLATPRRPIEVIYNGCDTRRFRPTLWKGKIRRELGLPERDPILLYAGRIVPEKGIGELLAAVAALPPFLTLVLGGPLSDRRLIDRLPARYPMLAGRVHHFPPAPQGEVARWMQAADIFVHPSHFEGVPNSVVEAMACGLAIVASDVGGTAEIVTHEATGLLVPPKAPAALSRALERLLNDAPLRERLGKNARAAILASRSWEENAKALLRAFHALLSPQPGEEEPERIPPQGKELA